MEEILFNFWGAELREKQKAVKDSISLNKNERAIVEQHPNTQMLTDQMQSRLNEILNLAMARGNTGILIRLFIRWSLYLFHDYRKRISADSSSTAQDRSTSLKYWKQEYMYALSSVFSIRPAQHIEAENNTVNELCRVIEEEICRNIDRYIEEPQADSQPEAEQPAKAKSKEPTRKVQNFRAVIINKDKAQAVIDYLHPKFDGKKGKHLAIAVQAAVRAGLILPPSFEELKTEFDIKGAPSPYYDKRDDPFPPEMLEAIIPENIQL